MSGFGKYYLRETGEEVQEAITDVREKRIYPLATQQYDGLLSKEDKKRIDEMILTEEMSIEEIDNLLNL